MPPSPRNDSPADAIGTRRFGPDRRLRRPADFAAVLGAPRDRSFRSARQWLSMTAAWTASEEPCVRFGVTVGRRNARRAVDRALVKRILREAARHAAAELESVCARRRLRLDVAFRLKAPRDRDPAAPVPALQSWRRGLRSEADGLLARLALHLADLPA